MGIDHRIAICDFFEIFKVPASTLAFHSFIPNEVLPNRRGKFSQNKLNALQII